VAILLETLLVHAPPTPEASGRDQPSPMGSSCVGGVSIWPTAAIVVSRDPRLISPVVTPSSSMTVPRRAR
jgi:uncharacterized spore protein YtfJ